MWCAACRADVAAELSSDNRRMLCARCHSELGSAAGAVDRPAAGPRTQDTERNARELLARWSTQHLLETPLGGSSPSVVQPPATPPLAIPPPAIPPSSAENSGLRSAHRIDASHAAVPRPRSANSELSPAGHPSDDGPVPESRRRTKAQRPRLAETADVAASAKPSHDQLVRTAIQQPVDRPGNWTTSIGQLCAYGGVAVLTLGTVMVLSGYFGGPANYAPTGWLVAAVGQMLLFLGVVTLVSGGMEQTVDEVSWRIDHLSEQIQRLEQVIAAQQSELADAKRRARRRNEPPRADAA